MQETMQDTTHESRTADGTANTAQDPAVRAAAVAQAPKADLGKRFIAVVIDAVAAAALGAVPVVGGIAGAAYMVVRDGLDVDFMKNRSLGKKVMKLRPLRMDGRPVDLQTSLQRNWMFGIGALAGVLLFIPVLGWLLIPVVGLAGLAIGAYELYKVTTDGEGRRWGDHLAGTKVIEAAD